MPKKIAVASIVVALMGLYNELMLTSVWNMSTWKYYLKDFCTSLNLGYLGIESRIDKVNYLNVFFFSLLLTGGILYFFSKKETRLVRYVLSMILLSKGLKVFFMVIYLPFSFDWILKGFNSAIFTGYLAWHLLWVWLCYKALKYFRDAKQIAVGKLQHDDGTEYEIISESSRWQRFFNLIADICTFIFILFPILESLVRIDAVREFLSPLESNLGMRLGLYFIAVILQTIYYMLFEGLFQATPGKMLTETRVVTDTGGKPSTGKLFVRTIVRFVPFESLSVLFARGWHDDWSDTYVVREKREGVNGGWYFFIFPAFLFLGTVGYLGYKSYEKHQAEKRHKEEFEMTRDRLKKGLGHLTENHVITVARGYGGQAFMKVERITADSIAFAVVRDNGGYPESYQMEIEPRFEGYDVEYVTVAKKELSKGIREYKPEDDNTDGDRQGEADLLNDGNLYHIEDIAEWFAPNLTLQSAYMTSSDKDVLSVSVKNTGWPADIVKIHNKADAIAWPPLPIKVDGSVSYNHDIEISGKGEDIEDINTDITIKDSSGRIQVYNLKGDTDDLNRAVLTRIK